MATTDPPRLSRFFDWLTGQRSRVTPNGNGSHSEDAKAASSSGVIAPWIGFTAWNQPNGGQVWLSVLDGSIPGPERVGLATAYCAAAYAFAAMRYRAEKLAEPPLMVVEEDPDTGDEDWIPDHALEPLLDQPSPDYDMGELLFRTSLKRDQTGAALWILDRARGGLPGRIGLFGQNEFEIEMTRDRIRGRFRIQTADGERIRGPEDVVLFEEPDPNNWLRGLSRLGVYLDWLNLGQQTRGIVEDLLRNSVWPSLILQPDPTWNPDKEQFEEYKAAAESYGDPGRRGKPLSVLGGGSATVVSARIRDILPADILNRVESIASVVFGIPAIVLQYQVGMENSPWSQMAEARRMCTEDTLEPMWRAIEKLLTRQVLRPIDPDPRHLIRFDTSKVRALVPDRERLTTMAVAWSRFASLNERRALVGLEPVDDPKADEIPELRQPDPTMLLGGAPAAEEGPDGKAARRRSLYAAVRRDQADRTIFDWQLLAQRQLETDREKIAGLAESLLEAKADVPSEGARRRFIQAVSVYLKEEAAAAWGRAANARIAADAAHSAAVLTADLGFRFDQVREGVADYAKREAAWLVRHVTDTTRDAIRAALTEGIEQGLGAREIAGKIRQATAFNRDRALLVARTEATRVNNGAPVETLQAVARESGKVFLKTWSTAQDDRVRDEHVKLEGETVGIDADFSNGLPFPSEPNCRCVLTFSERRAP